MILERGNMWDIFGHTDLFLITTNPIRRKDGAVVMGRGIAKEAKDRFPSMPYDFGTNYNGDNVGYIGHYGEEDQGVDWFMTKTHWREASDIEVIKQSIKELAALTKPGGNFMCSRADLNFPGIGNGKLKREDVLPLLEELPDNVHVWEYG